MSLVRIMLCNLDPQIYKTLLHHFICEQNILFLIPGIIKIIAIRFMQIQYNIQSLPFTPFHHSGHVGKALFSGSAIFIFQYFIINCQTYMVKSHGSNLTNVFLLNKCIVMFCAMHTLR